MIPEQLHDRLKKAVSANAKQNPLYGFLHDAGGEPEASFVFFRRGTSALDAAMRQKMERIEKMKTLDAEAAERAKRQQEEIARKQAQLHALDQRLAELRRKVGAGNAGETEFDELVAIADERTRRGVELEALRKKAEEELRLKEQELAEARRKQEKEQNNKMQTDIQTFNTKVFASNFVDDAFKAQAWKALCRKWGVPETTPIGSNLVYSEGKTHVGQGLPTPGGGGKKITNTIGMVLILITAGEFTMGSPATEKGRDDDETEHLVKIPRPFYLCTTEVTQAQYEAVMGDNPSFFKGKELPVESVSYDQAMEFCKKLSAMEKVTYRLPTEAEWEYACRAGTKTAYCFGDSDRALGEHAWYDVNNDSETHAVGEKKPNAWGLYDMHGNVWEWVMDWYGEYKAGAETDPQGPFNGVARVFRGGSWYSSRDSLRCAMRNRFEPFKCYPRLGFRVAMSLP